jgi:signal transduction histidine kinase
MPVDPTISTGSPRAQSDAEVPCRPEISEAGQSKPFLTRHDTYPRAFANDERARFETLLMQLSATFVNVPANQVDSTIGSALRQIVQVLRIDRSGFGEMSADRTELLITHSYQVPGVPPSPRVLVDEQLPWYAGMIRQGEVIRLERLPEDLPSDAIHERMYCAQSGLKSNLTIPLKVMGSVVGGIGFASFHSYREWPDELVQRLSLIGDIFTNALARKQADEALQKATEQARLLRDELAHAIRLELVNHLTASIAHEVNQPLCAIASNAQSALDLLDMGNSEEARGALTDIWGDAKRASDVIGRIRGMVRKEEPLRADCNLASIIEELAPLLSREADAKGVTLQSDFNPGGPHVLCDRVQLQQVMLNLVLNAVEAASESQIAPPKVLVRIDVVNDDWVDIAVENTGVGLSDEACERVFAPFFTTKAKGLGMGLGISRSIVAAHGGRLWATPGAKEGTVFHVRLPVASRGLR